MIKMHVGVVGACVFLLVIHFTVEFGFICSPLGLLGYSVNGINGELKTVKL